MRLGVLDLGLASFHLAVFEMGDGGELLGDRRSWTRTVCLADMAGPRLGAALTRALGAVKGLLRDLHSFDARCAIVAIASSALCAIENGREFCSELARRQGLTVELLTGEHEARLSYLGARSRVAVPGRLVVADVGGSSLGLATGTGMESDLEYSMPLGVNGLRSVHLHAERALDRTARDRMAATVRFGAGEATRAIWDRRPDSLAFTSSTAGALASLGDELGLRHSGANELGLAALDRLVDVLAQFQPIELPALEPEEARSDTVAVGAVVMHTLMELLGFDSAIISSAGRREGVALCHFGLARSVLTEGRVHTAVT